MEAHHHIPSGIATVTKNFATDNQPRRLMNLSPRGHEQELVTASALGGLNSIELDANHLRAPLRKKKPRCSPVL